MTSCCVIQEQLNIQTRKRIGASGSSVKNVEIPAIRNQFGLINLYFTLTQGGLTLIFSVSSRSSVKAPIIAQNTPSSFFYLARVATSYKSRDHAKFVVISEESHAIMKTLHYAGKQKVLRHVSLNICQLTEVIKVFSSVSAVSYDENL